MKNTRINTKRIKEEKKANRRLKLSKTCKKAIILTALSTGLLRVITHDDSELVINVGNHSEIGSIQNELKMYLRSVQHKNFGIVVTPEDISEVGIYNDVELVKNYLNKYDINLPVYIDIKPIVSDKNLNVTTQKRLIDAFLDKCSSNGMYVGVYGEDKLLTSYYEALKLEKYDAYLIMDSDQVTYPGAANIIEDGYDNIMFKKNISEIIKNKDLNNPDNFLNDGIHVMNENETITDISIRYDMSVNELLEYNNLKEEDITKNVEVKIPSRIARDIIINKQYKVDKKTQTTLKTPLAGCDMSEFQSKTDWDKISKNFEFVILRASYGLEEDAKFSEYAAKCATNDIKMGVYCFNTVLGTKYSNMDEFKKAATKQANYVLKLMENKNVTYPVYLDLESNGKPFEECFKKEELEALLEIWNTKMSENGYVPGVYSNKSIYDYISKTVETNIPENFEVWIAGGSQYTAEKTGIDIKNVKPTSNEFTYKDSKYEIDTAQVTDEAINSGAGNHKGHVDVNYTYTDYAEETITEEKNIKVAVAPDKEIDYKEFDLRTLRHFKEQLMILAAMGLGSAAIVARRKQIEKRIQLQKKYDLDRKPRTRK